MQRTTQKRLCFLWTLESGQPRGGSVPYGPRKVDNSEEALSTMAHVQMWRYPWRPLDNQEWGSFPDDLRITQRRLRLYLMAPGQLRRASSQDSSWTTQKKHCTWWPMDNTIEAPSMMAHRQPRIGTVPDGPWTRGQMIRERNKKENWKHQKLDRWRNKSMMYCQWIIDTSFKSSCSLFQNSKFVPRNLLEIKIWTFSLVQSWLLLI